MNSRSELEDGGNRNQLCGVLSVEYRHLNWHLAKVGDILHATAGFIDHSFDIFSGITAFQMPFALVENHCK